MRTGIKILSVICVLLILLGAGGALAWHFWLDKPRHMVSIDEKGNLVVTQDNTPVTLN